jgi:hypothetical protein
MVLTDFGMVMLFSNVHPKNARALIAVTVFGIVTDVIFLFDLKAFVAIDVTEYFLLPIVTDEGIVMAPLRLVD